MYHHQCDQFAIGDVVLPKKSFVIVQTGVRELVCRELPIPQIDANSAILRIEACGICGSDYEQYEGLLGAPIPAVPGHEPWVASRRLVTMPPGAGTSMWAIVLR